MENKNNAITSQSQDFAQWYTDVVRKAELMNYASVKGFINYLPYSYAIWEEIQNYFNRRIKNELGAKNVYLPLVIPMSMFNKEKEHVEGFAPEASSPPLAEPSSLKILLSSVQPLRSSSATSTNRLSPLIETSQFPSTSGAPSSVGKRPPVHSSVALNSSGRKDTAYSKPKKKRETTSRRPSTSMMTLAVTC